MRILKQKPVVYEKEATFKGIPEDLYYKKIAQLDQKIRKDLQKNQIGEAKSNEFAARFVTTVNG